MAAMEVNPWRRAIELPSRSTGVFSQPATAGEADAQLIIFKGPQDGSVSPEVGVPGPSLSNLIETLLMAIKAKAIITPMRVME